MNLIYIPFQYVFVRYLFLYSAILRSQCVTRVATMRIVSVALTFLAKIVRDSTMDSRHFQCEHGIIIVSLILDASLFLFLIRSGNT